jgi:hypothetical protein
MVMFFLKNLSSLFRANFFFPSFSVMSKQSGGEAAAAALQPDLFVTSSDDTTAKVYTLPDMPLQAFGV